MKYAKIVNDFHDCLTIWIEPFGNQYVLERNQYLSLYLNEPQEDINISYIGQNSIRILLKNFDIDKTIVKNKKIFI